MQVIVKGHHIHVSDQLRDATVHKLEKLSRFFDRIQKIEVEFSHEKTRRAAVQNRVEVLLTSPLGAVRAHAKAIDPEGALDDVVDKLERQVKKLKDKVVRRGTAKGGIRARAREAKVSALRAFSPEPVKPNGASPEVTDEDRPARLDSSQGS